MNILLTGASGFVGGNLALGLDGSGSITATYHSTSVDSAVRAAVETTVRLDLSEKPAVDDLLAQLKPNLIIHCAALAQPAACQRDSNAAQLCNVEAIRHLTSFYQNKTGSKPVLVYLSTDLVFDGAEAPVGGFKESVEPKPSTIYGQSKLAGEQILREYHGSCSVLRLSLVYGNRVNGKQGFLGWLTERFRNGDPLPLFVDEWRTPVSSSDIVLCIKRIIERIVCEQQASIPKLLHCAGSERLNRLQFGEKVAQAFDYDRTLIQPENRPSNRCADVSLCSQRFKEFLGRQPLSVMNGLALLDQ